MPQTERFGLADVNAGHARRDDITNGGEQFVLAGLRERALELGIGIEVIFDRSLGCPGYEDQLGRTCGDGLLDRVLDQRLVDDGEHFLGTRLGCRQKTGAPACHRKYGCSYSLGHEVLHSVEVARIITNSQVPRHDEGHANTREPGPHEADPAHQCHVTPTASAPRL